jgi:hypothetical protein
MKNKRVIHILLIALGLLFSVNSFAWKLRTDTLVYAGAWGGASYARLMGYTQPTFPLTGSAYGVKFWLQPTREYSISTGIALINKGYMAEIEHFNIYNNSIGFFPTNYSFSYLNIPFSLNYNLGRNRFNIYLKAGIDIDILLKQHSYSTSQVPEKVDGIDVNRIDSENTDIYKKINFSVHIGGGIEYRFKPNIIAFGDVKYMHGLNNILAVNSIYNLKQRPIVFGLGIRIGIPITVGYYD